MTRKRTQASRPAPEEMPFLVLDLQSATHAVGLHLEGVLAELGLSQGEAHVLARLADADPHALTVGDLQRALHLRPSTLSGILDRLESRGLVGRTLNDADRRSLLVALSRAGRDAARAVLVALASLESGVAERVSARDLAAFRSVLAALVSEAH